MMNYSFTEVNRKFSIEEACAVLAASPVISPDLKEIYTQHAHNATPPLGLSLWAANQMVSALTSTMTSTPGSTPPQRIASYSMSTVVTLMENSLTIETPQPQVMTPVMGIFVKPEEVTDAVRYRTSSVFSYTYGESPVSNKNTSDVYSRFFQDRTNMGVPHVPDVIRRQPTWSDDMLVVDQAMFRSTETQDQMAAATNQAYEILKKAKPDIQTDSGVIPMYTPPAPTSENLAQAYTLLSAHRAVRGEDKSGASHLTAGYYNGAIPRTLESLFFKVADVMHISQLLKTSAVEICGKLPMSIATSLARSGLVVVVRGQNTRVDPFVYNNKTNPPTVAVGVYRCPIDDAPPIPRALLIGLMPDQRPIVKDGVLREDPALVANVTRYLKSDRVVMVWSFLSPELLALQRKYERIALIPSHHAHSLSVIVMINSGLTSWDMPTLTRRGVHANIIKTHFPYSRATFINIDRRKYGFESQALRCAMRLSHLPILNKVTKVFEDFGIIEEDDQADIEDYTSYEARLAEFYATKRSKYVPSQPRLLPPLSVIEVDGYNPMPITGKPVPLIPSAMTFTEQQSVAYNADDLSGDLLFQSPEEQE